MELEVQHENQTIILWLRSGCRTDLSLLYELGKTWRYRVVVIRSGFGSLINNTSTLLWFNCGTPIGRDSHGYALAASLHWRKGEDYNNRDIRGKEILIWKQELKSRIVSRVIAGFPWMWKRIGITRASKTRRTSFPTMFSGTFQIGKFNLNV